MVKYGRGRRDPPPPPPPRRTVAIVACEPFKHEGERGAEPGEREAVAFLACVPGAQAANSGRIGGAGTGGEHGSGGPRQAAPRTARTCGDPHAAQPGSLLPCFTHAPRPQNTVFPGLASDS